MRTFLRFVVVVAALVAVVVYWNFGTVLPCGVLREAVRQRGDVVAIFPDGVIDFGFEAQFGEMSQSVASRCCSKPLLRRCRPPGKRPNCRCNRSRPDNEDEVRGECG